VAQVSDIEFQAHYQRLSGPLFRFIFRYTNNQEATEEVLHDIFEVIEVTS
jgi:DNA-directed RNA polymerase specialized sigma24 family protein